MPLPYKCWQLCARPELWWKGSGRVTVGGGRHSHTGLPARLGVVHEARRTTALDGAVRGTDFVAGVAGGITVLMMVVSARPP